MHTLYELVYDVAFSINDSIIAKKRMSGNLSEIQASASLKDGGQVTLPLAQWVWLKKWLACLPDF